MALDNLTRHLSYSKFGIAGNNKSFNKAQVRGTKTKVVGSIAETKGKQKGNRKLDLGMAIIVVVSDASFANNADLSYQLGHISVLAGDSGKENVLAYGN